MSHSYTGACRFTATAMKIQSCVLPLNAYQAAVNDHEGSMLGSWAVLDVACHFTILQAYAGTHVALAGSHTETSKAKKGGVQRRSLTTRNNQNSPKVQSASGDVS